jgi:hypothetical protein
MIGIEITILYIYESNKLEENLWRHLLCGYCRQEVSNADVQIFNVRRV